MPPETSAVPIPTTRGRDASEWLEAHGLLAVNPTIRSSDRDISTDPFAYFLIRRLGLVPAFRTSEALSRGSWFHARFEFSHAEPNTAQDQVLARLGSRLKELQEFGDAFGVEQSALDRQIDRERNDCFCAMGWYEALSTVVINRDIGTFPEYLSTFEVLGSELLAVWNEGPGGKRNPHIAPFDKLLFHPKQNALWICDAKTCAASPKVRLQACSIEFQSWHYLQVLRGMLDAGYIHAAYPHLPPDVRIGGIMHVAFQKPTIKFGRNDRPYRYRVNCTVHDVPTIAFATKTSRTQWSITLHDPATLEVRQHLTASTESEALNTLTSFTSGLKKDAPKKDYQGEDPDIDIYIERCTHWYEGTGPYQSEKLVREADPPVNISYTEANFVLSEELTHEYSMSCEAILDLARRKPYPSNYPRRGSSLLQFGKLSPYHAFYVTPPHHWPEIIQRERFVVSPRDADLDLTPGVHLDDA